jgi:hypothetical protein
VALKYESPAVVGALFSIYISIITVGVELNFKLDPILFEWFRWFWGLTCDFWEEFEENIFSLRVRDFESAVWPD